MRNTLKNLKYILLPVICILMSCSNEASNCYDQKLYEEHKDDICTMDCPGVIGCDDIEYCNECIALTKGIRLKK